MQQRCAPSSRIITFITAVYAYTTRTNIVYCRYNAAATPEPHVQFARRALMLFIRYYRVRVYIVTLLTAATGTWDRCDCDIIRSIYYTIRLQVQKFHEVDFVP